MFVVDYKQKSCVRKKMPQSLHECVSPSHVCVCVCAPADVWWDICWVCVTDLDVSYSEVEMSRYAADSHLSSSSSSFSRFPSTTETQQKMLRLFPVKLTLTRRRASCQRSIHEHQRVSSNMTFKSFQVNSCKRAGRQFFFSFFFQRPVKQIFSFAPFFNKPEWRYNTENRKTVSCAHAEIFSRCWKAEDA